jgi:hypothetical protein
MDATVATFFLFCATALLSRTQTGSPPTSDDLSCFLVTFSLTTTTNQDQQKQQKQKSWRIKSNHIAKVTQSRLYCGIFLSLVVVDNKALIFTRIAANKTQSNMPNIGAVAVATNVI